MRKLILSFFLQVFLIVLVAFSSYYIISNYEKSFEWKNHTFNVLSAVSELQLRIAKAESSLKSYRLTKDKGYLQEYEENKNPNFENLLLLVSDDLKQIDSLNKLKRDLGKKVDYYNNTSTFNYPNDESLNRQIDADFKAIKDEENSLLVLRTEKFNADTNKLKSYAVIVSLTCLLLLLVVFVTVRKQFKDIVRLKDSLLNKTKVLENINKELESFAHVASHDLQQPLRTVSAFTELIKKKYSSTLDEKANEYLSIIAVASEKMGKLIDNLLSYAVSGKGTIVEVDTTEIVEEIKKYYLLEPVEITYTNLPVVNATELGMKMIFQNLISNAIKFTGKGVIPLVQISGERTKTDYLFKVSDNGIGVNESDYEEIFKPFVRMHKETAYSGTGLGLAIVRNTIENLNGKIWVESNGGGTTFVFTLPI